MRSIGAVVLPNHNLSQTATYVINIYKDSSLTVLAGTYSGTLSPVIYPFGSVPFEDVHWYNGQYTAEEYSNFLVPVLALFTPSVIGRYVQVQITDTSNVAGYIQLPRLFISPGYQPSINMAQGAQLIPVDPSPIVTTLGGYRAIDQRPKFREFHLVINAMPNSEAFAQAFDQQFANGLGNQVFFSANPSDMNNLFGFSFLANMTKLNPITLAQCGYSGVGYDFIEVVA